jgi:hypothetical protein
MKEVIDTSPHLADAEFDSYTRQADVVTIRIRCWNNTLLTFRFHDAIGLVDRGIGDVTKLVRETDGSSLLDSSLAAMYVSAPSEHPYSLFQFLDIDDNASLEIVAQNVKL